MSAPGLASAGRRERRRYGGGGTVAVEYRTVGVLADWRGNGRAGDLSAPAAANGGGTVGAVRWQRYGGRGTVAAVRRGVDRCDVVV